MSEIQNRRSERVMLRLDLLVRLEVGEGSGPQTHAFTVKVNAHGGLLVACRVVEVHASYEGYFTTAFEFEQRSPQFWAVDLPPEDWDLI